MIIIDKISFSYDDKIVLKDLNWIIKPKAINGLVGLNGSGKTTLLNLIYGNFKPFSGTITIDNHKLTKKTIAFLESENFFYQKINGFEYLNLFKYNNENFDISQWNKLFHLPLNALIETYSTGMKKKLAFLGVLSLNKPILMLDEPFNGLDIESSRHMINIIKVLRENGFTIIITSHILESLTSICDSISYINNCNIEFVLDKDNFDDIEERIFKNVDENSFKLISSLLKTQNDKNRNTI